jgi:hypothetical protein
MGDKMNLTVLIGGIGIAIACVIIGYECFNVLYQTLCK